MSQKVGVTSTNFPEFVKFAQKLAPRGISIYFYDWDQLNQIPNDGRPKQEINYGAYLPGTAPGRQARITKPDGVFEYHFSLPDVTSASSLEWLGPELDWLTLTSICAPGSADPRCYGVDSEANTRALRALNHQGESNLRVVRTTPPVVGPAFAQENPDQVPSLEDLGLSINRPEAAGVTAAETNPEADTVQQVVDAEPTQDEQTIAEVSTTKSETQTSPYMLYNLFEQFPSAVKRRQFSHDQINSVDGIEIRGKELTPYMNNVLNFLKKYPEFYNLVKTYVKSVEIYDAQGRPGAMANDVMGDGAQVIGWDPTYTFQEIAFYRTAQELVARATIARLASTGENLAGRYAIDFSVEGSRTPEVVRPYMLQQDEANITAGEAQLAFAIRVGREDIEARNSIEGRRRTLDEQRARVSAARNS